ncbi:MAG: transporter substrate-binding domain-containing protein [Candidatus Rokubacteria bacterium]|nr:transporter substrate-binding domain-containing protein [Candidatus Rokubacteria bacterium]
MVRQRAQVVAPAQHQLGRHRGGVWPRRLRLAWFLLAVALAATVSADAEVRGIRLCADPSNLPFSSQDPNEPGFEVEIARALAEGLGVELRVHWFPTFRGFLAFRQLYEGRCDLFMGLPLTERFTRENPRVVLSVPYYVMGQVLVSPAVGSVASPEALKGKLVGVQAMTLSDELVFQRGYNRRIYLTPEETFAALAKGEVDAVVMWSPLAGWLAKKNPGFKLTWLNEPELEFKIAVGMRKADRALKEAVDRALTRLDPKKIAGILARYGVPAPAAAQQTSQLPPEIREGRSSFFTSCSECHGVDGKGTFMAPSLVAFKGTDDEFVKIVMIGRAGTAMVSWRGILSEDEIRKIRAFLKTLPAN